MKNTLLTAGMIAGAMALLGLPGMARAEFITGAELAKACAPTTREAASCNAFIAGALDEVEATPELKARICLPPGTKLGVLRQSVSSFVQERPDAARGSAVALVNAMVTSHFPCKS